MASEPSLKAAFRMPCLKTARLKTTRLAALTAVAFGLAACETVGIDQTPSGFVEDLKAMMEIEDFGQSCDPEMSRRLVNVPWQFAEVVNIRIRQGEFKPMVITLAQNEPYVFRFTNRDDQDHTFRAREFFQNVAVASVPGMAPDMEALQGQTDSFGMALEPDQDLTPLEDGQTEFERTMGGTPGQAPETQSGPMEPSSDQMGPDPFVQAMQGALDENGDDAGGQSAPQDGMQPATATELMGMEGESACALHVSSVDIPAMSSVEVRLVAVRDGRYPFEDTFLMIPTFYIGGATGVVVIEQPL